MKLRIITFSAVYLLICAFVVMPGVWTFNNRAVLVPDLTPVAEAKSTRVGIVKTADGTAQQITTDTTIFTRKFSVQSKVGNAATVYVGLSTVSSTVHFYSLAPGSAATFQVSEYEATRGQQFQLSTFYVLGTASDLIVINYEVTTS